MLHPVSMLRILRPCGTERFKVKANTTASSDAGGEGNGLYLTPYLKDGLIDQAQNASHVTIPFMEKDIKVDSHSGYMSVGPGASCHLFFWYFLYRGMQTFSKPNNQADGPDRPLVVWLNGGPGISSMVGLFEELGPLRAGTDGSVSLRDGAWTDHFNVLFIDSPMATGFSYSDTGELTKSVKETAENLYEFIVQFFKLFPDTKTKDFYIGGQSYGGKYVPEFAALVKADDSIKLKGIFVGGGLFDPVLMLPLFPDYLYELGMLSDLKRNAVKTTITKALVETHKTDPDAAIMDIIDCIFDKTTTDIGFNYTENVLYPSRPRPFTLETYLNQPEVQKAIHVKPTQFVWMNGSVLMGMARDFTGGVQNVLGELLDSNLKVLMFNGQMDIAVTIGMAEKFLSDLTWSGGVEYQKADKAVWKDDKGAVAGYVIQVRNFTRVVIRNAGHRTVINQPCWVMDMMLRFVHGRSFS